MEDDTTANIVNRIRRYANAKMEGEWAAVVAHDLNSAADEIERLRAERDEARRSLCECLANGVSDATLGEWFQDDGRHLLARDAATERGWDCFEPNGKAAQR